MLDNAHLQHLVDSRALAIEAREVADATVKTLNTQLEEALAVNGVKRHQLISGAIVQMIEPRPRLTILADRLLEAGVAPTVIKAATAETPVKPFIRVDPPTGSKSEAAAAAVIGPPSHEPVDAPPPTVN